MQAPYRAESSSVNVVLAKERNFYFVISAWEAIALSRGQNNRCGARNFKAIEKTVTDKRAGYFNFAVRGFEFYF